MTCTSMHVENWSRKEAGGSEGEEQEGVGGRGREGESWRGGREEDWEGGLVFQRTLFVDVLRSLAILCSSVEVSEEVGGGLHKR